MRHLLLVRGTSWQRPHAWRVRELRGKPRDWNQYTTSDALAEYPAALTPEKAAARALAEFPGDQIYMRVDEPGAVPLRGEKLTVARLMPRFN